MSSEEQGIPGNGGSLTINQEADMEGVGKSSFSKQAVTDSLSMTHSHWKGFGICMDTNIENAISEHTPNGDTMTKNPLLLFPCHSHCCDFHIHWHCCHCHCSKFWCCQSSSKCCISICIAAAMSL